MKNRHFTSGKPDRYLHRISADFMIQIENEMEERGISRKDVAEKLGATRSWVSQILNDPGNLTLETMLKFSSAIGLKLAVLAYDDDDPDNDYGPIVGDVFKRCWKSCHEPKDLSDIEAVEVHVSTFDTQERFQYTGTVVCIADPQAHTANTKEMINWPLQRLNRSYSNTLISHGLLLESMESRVDTGVYGLDLVLAQPISNRPKKKAVKA